MAVLLPSLAAPAPPYIEFPEELPVCGRRADIAAALSTHAVVIVCGETGSGKTTQLPKIAWAAGRGQPPGGMRIGMTQPRRIAAKSVAQRLAQETRTSLGGFIGWQVRFTDQVSPQSRIKVMTDGILLAETQSDPELRAYDTIILDEAHERSVNIDFLLGYLKNLLPRRPDLKLIVSSATLEAERFAAYFGGVPVIEVSGRSYPVEIRWRPPERRAKAGDKAGAGAAEEDEADLETALLDAVDELAREGPGDILVFLPGEREIRDAQEALRKHHPPGAEILPLYARLSVAEQDRVFAPHAGRRIVLATNVAETSLTVPGIRYVVDTGLARVKRYSMRNRIEQLKTEKISQASARQRAGRCGRVAAGICIRLYDEADFLARPAHTTPEILRASLAGVILRMKALRLPDIATFPFLDPPEPRRVNDGLALLRELGAIDAAGALTPIGQALARLPIDPRLGRMLIAAREKAVLAETLVIAAYLSVQDPRERPLERPDAADQKHRRFADEDSDFIAILRLWAHVDALNAQRKSQRSYRSQLRDEFLSPQRVREWRDVHGQLANQVKEMGWPVGTFVWGTQAERDSGRARAYAPLHQALLTGLLGNVGMLTEAGDYLGARGMRFLPFPGSGVKKKPKWVMAAEIVETRRVYARTLARIEPEWIEHAGRHLLKVSYSDPHWEKRPAHVAAAMRATLYGLPVVNGRRVHYGPINPAHARELFIRALAAGEYAPRAAFFEHNQRLRETIDAEAHRARDIRLAVDEEELYRFYEARIPEDICTGVAFERWLRVAEAQSPRLLYMRREDLLRGRGADAQAYPTEIELNGVRFALVYRFEPGAADDGVTLLVPLAALNQVPEARCEWLVPGMLEEKIAALLRTLPPSLRRAYVPLPEFARAAASELSPQNRPLTEALGEYCARRTGESVPREAWRIEALPAHLRMNFRVLDARNQIVGEGRDLFELRRQHGDAARLSLRAAAAGEERQTVAAWDFGDLPEQVTLRRGAQTVVAYPALADEDGQVALRLFDSAALAREKHRRGVCRLLWLSFPDLARQTEKDLTLRLKDAAMHYALLDKTLGIKALLSDVLVAAARALLPEDAAELRRQNAFESAAAAARPKLAETAREMARLAAECLDHAHRLRQALRQPLPSAEAADDMRAQLQALIHPGFMAEYAPARLGHLPRYLRAMERRLEKLARQPARDAKLMQSMRPLFSAWQARVRRESDASGVSQAMQEFRWHLEELRVSLFAQELKTPEPVSIKRLEKLWFELTR